jgi:hypothetical protein
VSSPAKKKSPRSRPSKLRRLKFRVREQSWS